MLNYTQTELLCIRDEHDKNNLKCTFYLLPQSCDLNNKNADKYAQAKH